MEKSQFIGLQWYEIVWDLTIFQIACKMDQRGRRPQDLIPHCLFGALPCQPKIPIIHHHCHYFHCYEFVPVHSKVPQWHEMLLHLILAYIVTPVPNANRSWRRRTWACRKPFLSILRVPAGQSEKMLTAWFSSEPVQVQLTIAQMTLLTCVHWGVPMESAESPLQWSWSNLFITSNQFYPGLVNT